MESTAVVQRPEARLSVEDAIRHAAKLAIDEGDFDRATELLGMLGGGKAKPENVIHLAARRRGTS